MPMRGTLTIRTRDHILAPIFDPEFLVVCGIVAIGLAASLVFFLVFPTSTGLTVSLAQLGG